MLLCPKCQSRHLSVIDSRKQEDTEYLFRRRQCEDCGHRFSTAEIPKEQYDAYREMEQEQNKVYRWEKTITGDIVCGRCKKSHLQTLGGSHLLSPFCPFCGADLRATKDLGSFSPLEFRLR